ncbi:MAG: hypothetical protein J6V80_05140 [Clostridia bacterium]|nr:hypothetical protein [Clostridia bacterium]
MSDQENLDIGKIIGLIMENPQLIEQISNLAKKQQPSTSEPEQINEVSAEVTVPIEEASQVSAPTYQPQSSIRGNRAQLLNALKPYISNERAKAIDSMMSIADILDVMKTR